MLNLQHGENWHVGRPTPIWTPEVAPPAPPPVFVAFAGQSNMVGMNMSLATLATTGWKPDPLTFVWNNQVGRFEMMNPTVNTNAFSWGPAVGFAMQFRADHPTTALYIVQTAAGQTGLAQNVNQYEDWSPQSVGEMFDKMTGRLDAASALLGKRPDAVFIDQGETDGDDKSAADAYQSNFEAFLSAVRTRWMHDANGYVAWARVPDSSIYWHEIRDAQLAVDQETSRTDSFDTLDVSLQADHLHYDAAGLLTVGHRLESLFEAHGL